ncbi:quinone oxidoreductase [Ensifer adhaerens]|uniref:quinone oxidoreductase family protein n=1 Tax=Ensifer adhaerens TaxID=106592 RepID=UPI001CBAA58A|nr:quinone oxidoreductase [Ensifer adhaerens]MBZ7926434.1 quinone oxidoreductase [Ensifer adhaerens]UAX97212.1 quinone oxidoreductase [Ensifer adhaerens]
MVDQVVVLTSPGGVERFEVRTQEPVRPAAGEILVRHEAIGTNFLDIYHRKGIYPLPAYPAVLGVEAAGVVEASGAGVTAFREGDRIVYAGPPAGSYCSTRVISVDRGVLLPETIAMKTAATSMLKGMTAYMLLRKSYEVRAGSVVLVHAAAGGLGSVLVRMAKDLGAIVIGAMSTDEKAARAASYGADHLIVGRDADLVSEVKRITDGMGADVVYDGIGGDMLVKSIRAVRPFGTVATIGQAAGPIPPVSVDELRPGKALSHPSIMAFCADIERYREAATAALRAMEQGIVANVAAEHALADVAGAHREMESGHSAGSIALIP